MRSTVLILGLSGNLGKRETELNKRIAEKEQEGWDVVEIQTTRPSFGYAPVILVRLAMQSN